MYISYKLLPVKSSTSYKLLPVWSVLLLTSYKLLPGYCISVTCQITIMQLSLFKVANQKHTHVLLMLNAKRSRPLDIKSVALHRISSRNIVFQNGSVDIIDGIKSLNNMATLSNSLIATGLQK